MCKCAHVCVSMYICRNVMGVCVCKQVYVYICMCVCIDVLCLFACLCAWVYSYGINNCITHIYIYIYIHPDMDIYYENLTDMILEPEKPQDLSASWSSVKLVSSSLGEFRPVT